MTARRSLEAQPSRTDHAVEETDPLPPMNWFERGLDSVFNVLEAVMPSLSDLGILMIVLIALLLVSGSDLTPSADVIDAMQAAEAAAAAAPNYVPF